MLEQHPTGLFCSGTSPSDLILVVLVWPLPAAPKSSCRITSTGRWSGPGKRAARRNGWTIQDVQAADRVGEPGRLCGCLCKRPLVPEPPPLCQPYSLQRPDTSAIAPMLQAAKRAGALTLVDGAHAPGMIPLELEKRNVDFYAANLHKWGDGPMSAQRFSIALWSGGSISSVASEPGVQRRNESSARMKQTHGFDALDPSV